MSLKRLIYLPLFIAVWLVSPIAVYADPFINAFGFIHMGPVGQTCSICLPLSDLSFSVNISTPFFLTASTSGGGSVSVTAPLVGFFDGSVSITGGSGVVTTTGPGTASAHFGETVTLNIMNIGSSSGSVVFVDNLLGFSGDYRARPDQGESLFLHASVSITGDGNDLAYIQRAICPDDAGGGGLSRFF